MSFLELPRGENCFTAECARMSDLPDLLMLEREAFPIDGWEPKVFIKELEKRPDGIKVVREAGRVVGYVQWQIGYEDILDREDRTSNKEDGVICSLAVLKSQRGRGVGEFLLRSAIGDLSELRVPRIIASTSVLNTDMINLCTKVGFKQKGVTPGFYGKSDAVEMVWQPTR